MKNLDLKKEIIADLENKGLDFSLNVFAVSMSFLPALENYAKQVKYKRPKNSYVGLGKSFYLHLQKIASK